MKTFNTTGLCIPEKHYMVDITERLEEMKVMVDAGKYFTINRARQYGKTTTLSAFRKYLSGQYEMVSLSFQGIGNAGFSAEEDFVQSFCRLLKREKRAGVFFPVHIDEQLQEYLDRREHRAKLDELFDLLSDWCAEEKRPIVLMIDEVDSAADHQAFLDFLAMLREAYLSREDKGLPAFQSVILAGVTDIKHLKNKLRPEDTHKVNSPWNIAADFKIDMSLSEKGIRKMLEEYDADCHMGMDTEVMAKLLRDYTGGYPFLVSRLCELLHSEVSQKFSGLSAAWTERGMSEAVKLILMEKNTLFDSLTGKLTNYPRLKSSLRNMLMEGTRISYSAQQEEISQLEMYGLICRDSQNNARIANRIFETLLYNLFLTDEELGDNVFYRESDLAKNMFVRDGQLNMRMVLERFIVTYTQIFGPLKDKFPEKDGREQFLLYLRPIINGTGNYYIEAQTRDHTRTDVVVDYLGRQYVIELKIWRGPRYNAAGEQQIVEYLDYFNLQTGYMLSFNFNKQKEIGVKRVAIGDRVLFEGTL